VPFFVASVLINGSYKVLQATETVKDGIYMKNIIFVRNFVIFFTLLSICVGTLGGYIYKTNKELDLTGNWIFHTQSIIIESQELIAAVQAMVASQRGYLLSREQNFLNVFEANKEKASQHMATLSGKMQNNPSQQSRLTELQYSILKLMDGLDASIDKAKQDEDNIVPEFSPAELQADLRDEILRNANVILSQEYNFLTLRAQVLETRTRQYHYTLLVGGVVAALLLLIFNAFLLQAQSRRDEAEQSLRIAEERLQLAIRGSNDGIFDWDLITNELYWSPHYKAMIGYNDDELESSIAIFNEIIHPDDKEALWKEFNEYIKGNISEFSNIFRMKHKSGRWVWAHARGKATYNDEGKAIRFIGAHTDVTHIKEYEQQLEIAKENAEKANEAKGEFLAHMSHEIRTPLTAISGIAEIFSHNINDFTDKQRKLISTLASSAASLKDLITDILDFSKIESGEIDLNNESFPLDDLFAQVISITSMRAAEKKLDYSFKYESIANDYFYGDKARLRQILINLIGNAIKFTDRGFVRVAAEIETLEVGHILKIVVADSGIGIAKPAYDTIFEKFRQADSSVSRRYGGTGLGLPISKNLAELMGGDIRLESALGTGSTFTLLLPMKEKVTDGAAGVTNQIRIQKLNDRLKTSIEGKRHILLVEDYKGNIVVLGHILETLDLAYDVARTGVEAINLWKEKHYDLVIMDVQMPVMDGLTATRNIRFIEKQEGLEATLIVGLTAHALVADKEKCIEAGMNDYLSKPVDELSFKQANMKNLHKKWPGEDHRAA
jgi:PAS domain S-box-containing protein